MKKSGVRLSKNTAPIKYDIQLRPDLDNFTFEGVETITLSVLRKTKSIALHSKELEIETAEIKIGGEKVFGKISYAEEKETATFAFPKEIPKGKHKLTIVFKGILNDKMRGFYKSTYQHEGKTRHLATTQFEATDARRAFPCFDEPAQKAVFHVSLIVEKGKTAISNTLPVSVTEHESEYQIVKFSPTPKMSTYLLAFLVGDFEFLKKKTGGGVLVRVFTTPGKVHQAKFALTCAVKTLEFYEKYFDIKYPLPALDMIAIPDFASGAMENWGAITYRESALLVDPDHSSASNKQWVALVIAHEIAHQWFGNLVTMEWWTHLWLNEGFASYIEYLAVDKMFPKWDIWTQFSVNDLGRALELDGLLNTHPVEIPVHHPDEIGEIFDEVSYSKGASVIRMLASYLGEQDFRDGLRHYLKKHSYKNTETSHLWQAFEKISGKPVAQMMHNWTGNPGYPVVKARMQNGQLTLSQERFFASPISAKKANGGMLWHIPVLVKNQSAMQKYFLSRLSQAVGPRMSKFSTENYATAKKVVSNGDWTKINFGEAGFFRTAYSKELLERLREPIQNKKLSARDRLGAIRDLFALSEAGVVPTTDALEFLSAYKNENNYTVWLEIALGLARLEQLLAKTKAKEKLDKIVVRLFTPVLKNLGWQTKKGELHAHTLLRSLAIARLGKSGDGKTINKARKLLNSKKIDANIRGAVYTAVASNGGMKEYQALVARYKKETLHEEKNRLGGALGNFRDQKILKHAAEFAFSKSVRSQDTIGILSSAGVNPLGRDIWWSAVRKNWKLLVSRYGDGGHHLARLVKAIAGSAESKHFSSYKKFFHTHPAPGAQRAIAQVLERMEGNIAWLKRDGEKIKEFLEKRNLTN